MTRKRFCKKLMALGADRNTAARLASRVGPGRSFEEEYTWAAVTASLWSSGISEKKAKRALKEFCRAVSATTLSAGEFMLTVPAYPSVPIRNGKEVGAKINIVL